ncbi:Lysine-sensitive aspartokinase 3 [Hafnia alvei]|uniref:Lysine-sensitive aspartokinase 3 n=1 Tax=Hafnia alvei TaxID=569 RepID=A0A377PG73_HAFAL|nr:Lysine-sensitive aspartokinase 3 [Hafnia alvei]
MKNTIVAKFGGTSVSNADAMQNSANIVLSNPNVRVVVLSASAGVTNLLVELAGRLRSGEASLRHRRNTSHSVQHPRYVASAKRAAR